MEHKNNQIELINQNDPKDTLDTRIVSFEIPIPQPFFFGNKIQYASPLTLFVKASIILFKDHTCSVLGWRVVYNGVDVLPILEGLCDQYKVSVVEDYERLLHEHIRKQVYPSLPVQILTSKAA